MIRYRFPSIIPALLVAACLLFQISPAADNPTYLFLRNDVSARASAMGGSFVTVQNDPSALFYNPATVATIERPQASFGYTKHLLDINAGFATYAQEISGLGWMGIAVNYYNYGTFQRTDELANDLGTFGAGDFAFSLTMARILDENLFYGVTAKFIYSSIDQTTSSAIAGDIGILYIIPGDNPVTIGASITNAGTQLKPYLNTREKLPLDVKIGGSVKPQHLPLIMNLNFHHLNDDQAAFTDRFRAFTVGGEFLLSKVLRFRFGYQNEQRRELKVGSSVGMAGISLGGGIVMKSLRFDYAYSSLGKIGSLNRITVGMDL